MLWIERTKDNNTNLLLNVVQRVRRVDGEANKDDMGVRVRKRAQTVVVFLASSIPEGQLDVLAIDLDVGDVVLEHGGNIHLEVCTCPFSTTSANTTVREMGRTSGNVPLEKTIKRQVCVENEWSVRVLVVRRRVCIWKRLSFL